MATQNHNINVNVQATGTQQATQQLTATQNAATKLQSAFQSASSATSQLSENLGGLTSGNAGQAIGSIRNLTTGLGGFAAAGVGAAAAAVAVVSAIETIAFRANAAADAAAELADQIGVSMLQLEALTVIANENGGSVQGLQTMYDKLSVAMQKVAEGNLETINAFRALGIEQSELAGKSESEIAGVVIRNYEALGRTTEATAAVAKLLGESFRSQLPAIKAAAEEIDDARARVIKFGAEASPALVKAGGEQEKALEDLKLAWKGLGNEIAEISTGILTTLAGWASEALNAIRKVMKELREARDQSNAARNSVSQEQRSALMRQAEREVFSGGNAGATYGDVNRRYQELLSEQQKSNFRRMEIGAYGETTTAAAPAPTPLAAIEKSKGAGGKSAADEWKSVLLDMERQLAITKESSNYEKTLFETQKGRFKNFTDAQKEILLNGAKQLDLREQEEKTQKDLNEQLKEQERLNKEALKDLDRMLETQQKMTRQAVGRIAGIGTSARAAVSFADRTRGMGQVDRDRVAAQDQVRASASEGIAGLDKSLPDYLERVKEIRDAEKEATDAITEAAQQRKIANADWTNGAKDAFASYLDDVTNVSKKTEDLMSSAFKKSEDALVEFAMTGKLEVKGLISSILSDLARYLIQTQVMAPIIAGLRSLMGFADGGVFSGGNVTPFADGGVVTRPTLFPMTGGRTGLMGEAGPEAIMPLRRGPDGKLGVAASGGGGGGGMSIGQISIVVQGGNTNEDTAAALKKELLSTMQQVADGRIANARRSGGLLNQG